jgi:hypothetical protein
VLGEQDQLMKFGAKNSLTSRFGEGKLNFRPTFKYDPESEVYDTSKKMRVPSWTDRILYKTSSCTLNYYGRSEITFSDHRPVLAIFDCLVSSVDQTKKQRILFEILESLNYGYDDGTDLVQGEKDDAEMKIVIDG